jgi:hypothetical protein
MPSVGVDAFNVSSPAPPATAAALNAGGPRVAPAAVGPSAASGRRYDPRLLQGLLRTAKGDSVTPRQGHLPSFQFR